MSNMRILSSVLVMCVFGITSAGAAPSVKMLGTNTARIGTNANVVKSNTNAGASTQRLGSIRPKTVNAGTPVTVNKVISANNTADSASDARLSLGKYIHSTGVSAGTIKPASSTSTSTAGVAADAFDALVERVETLENGKQDAITPGQGLVLDGSTISLDPAVLQTQVEENVTTALEDNYYTADEINTILEESGVTPPTYASTTQENVSYDSIDVADTFDDNFDFAN